MLMNFTVYVHLLAVKINVYVRIATRQLLREGSAGGAAPSIPGKLQLLPLRIVENNVFLKLSAKARSRSTLETSQAPCSPVTTKAATSLALKFLGSSPSFTAAF